jgi:hypothetical protein
VLSDAGRPTPAPAVIGRIAAFARCATSAAAIEPAGWVLAERREPDSPELAVGRELSEGRHGRSAIGGDGAAPGARSAGWACAFGAAAAPSTPAAPVLAAAL